MKPEQIEHYRVWVDLETGGEALCRRMAEHSQDADDRQKWMLLAQVENATRQILIRHLLACGVKTTENRAKWYEGEARADAAALLPRAAFLIELRARVATLVDELRVIADASPEEERSVAQRLCAHEEAWLRFIDEELAGRGTSSTETAKAYLSACAGVVNLQEQA
jgi:hypothetical protein